MNIGIVVLDTLRYDVFTDQMGTVADRSDLVFEQLYSTSRWTTPAHASLFTGFYPSEVGTHTNNLHLTTDKRTLAEVLSDEGFSTYLASNNPHIDSFFSFDRGFGTVIRGPLLQGLPDESTGFDWFELNANLSDSLLRYPEAVYEVLKSDAPTIPTLKEGLRLIGTSPNETNKINWIFEGLRETGLFDEDEDSFIFINSMVPHSPYNPPEAYRTVEPHLADPLELLLSEEPVPDEVYQRQWESYNDCARYLDDALMRLFEDIDWDLLFILGDHGELFGEHGLRQHQYGMYEELIHVPAVAHGTSVRNGRTSELQSIVDVHRTILDAVGALSVDSRGENLFESPGREYIYAESVGSIKYSKRAKGIESKIPDFWNEPHWAYIDSGLDKVIVHGDGMRVVNVASGDLQGDEEALRRQSEAFRERLWDDSGHTVEREVDSGLEERLKHLGYK